MKTSPLPFALVLPLSLGAASCGGSAQDVAPITTPPPSATPSAKPTAPPAPTAPDDSTWITPGPAFDSSPLFLDQKLDAIAAKLEGAWVVSGEVGKEAWEIKGNVVIVANKRETRAYALTINSPCTLEMRRKDGMSITSHFVLDGDTLYTGLGDFGIKLKDGAVIACVSNGVYVFRKNKCDKHMFLGDQWRGEPAKCTLTKDAFEVTGDTGGKLSVHGNVVLSNDPAQMKAEKVADLAAGKAKIGK